MDREAILYIVARKAGGRHYVFRTRSAARAFAKTKSIGATADKNLKYFVTLARWAPDTTG